MTRPESTLARGNQQPARWEVPHFDRLAYFYGQVLTPQQLQRAQQSIYDRAKLHNRCLHGWGVVCGLEVKPGTPPEPECPRYDNEEPPPPTNETPRVASEKDGPPPGKGQEHPYRSHLWITPGLAIDTAGQEVVVREPLLVDVLGAMSAEDRRALGKGPATIYVSLRHHTFGIEPARPQVPDACGMPAEPHHSFLRDGACAMVTLQRPPQDERCETCCTPAPAETVLLACIHDFVPGQPITWQRIHNEVRRPLSLRVPTVITSVSWHHGAHYYPESVDDMLWNIGIQVRFSRPIRSETLQPGVFDVYLVELGKGRSGIVRLLKGEFVNTSQELVKEFTYRLTENERVDPGDRIVFVLRSDFILDGCCEPVDGTHVGGRVPSHARGDESYPSPAQLPPVTECAKPPRRFGPWTSGDRAGGGTFESWLFVMEGQERGRSRKEDAR